MLIKRPPIIVIMGHVDHGKTTLLDYIRKTNIAGKEAGGITQSIGAYEIEYPPKSGNKITFIDTPGHEAFSKIRSYGARVADIAVLVVAADDGVKPQTKDALKHIKSAGLPFVVAINKIDLPTANVEKVKQDLIQAEVYLEGMGGDISYQLISAKTGEGVNELLDLISLAAEMQELKYDAGAPASGVILTSQRDPRRGIIVGGIIKNGTLKLGETVFTSSAEGKIKSLENFLGNRIKTAVPSMPVLMFGFGSLPKVGEIFQTNSRPQAGEEIKADSPQKESGKTPGSEMEEGEEKKINLVIKSNETGSLDVLEDVVKNKLKDLPFLIIEKGVGPITEGDVKTAVSSDSIIIGFNSKPDKAALNLAKAQKIKIITSPIIYKLEDSLKELGAQLKTKSRRIINILATFGKKDGKQIVGGKVELGAIKNGERFVVLNEKEEEAGKGKIINLQSGKEDAAEVSEGKEVGLMVEADCEIKPNHRLAFEN